MRPARIFIVLVASSMLAACAAGLSETGWTSNGKAQPFDTAVAACNQITGGDQDYFTPCMAGRGWTKVGD